MPIGHGERGERPGRTGRRQTVAHDRVPQHVARVVEQHELEPESARVDGGRCAGERQAERRR